MALGTVTPRKAMGSTWANKKMRVVDVQLTSGANYTTGGETLNASACGLSRIEQANVLGLALPSGGATSRTVGVIYSNTTGRPRRSSSSCTPPLRRRPRPAPTSRRSPSGCRSSATRR
jgi:hypothetical protein